MIFYYFHILLIIAVKGDIIRISQDKEAVVGGVVVLECSTDLSALHITEDAIEWHHTGVNARDFTIVYKTGFIFNGFNGRANVTKNLANGEYNLVINNVILDDAGTYTCMENTGKKKKFELTVFVVIPSKGTCLSSITDAGKGIFETCDSDSVTITMSCKMSYRGNTDPMLEWTPSNTRIRRALPFVNNDRNKVITSSITVTINRTTNYPFTCGVRYKKSNIRSSYVWSSSPSFRVYPISASAKRIEASCEQKEVDCSVDYKRHKCSHTWASDNGHVLDGAILHLTNLPSGLYTCTANCILNEVHTCSFIAVTTNYEKCNDSSKALATTGGSVVILIIIASIVGVAIVFKRRSKICQ